MAEPEYPDAWLLAWAKILRTWPGAGPMPRVDIVHVKREGRPGPLGKYDMRRHAVVVYADGDRYESLGTLIHELAHAWTDDGEKAHHGPVWRNTFVALFEWLVGARLDLERAIGMVRELFLREANGPARTKAKRNGDGFHQLAIDFTVVSQLMRLEPAITISDDTIFAYVGQCMHKVENT